MIGVVWDQESRNKMSSSLVGRILTEEWKHNISKGMKGNNNGKWSEETKSKMSADRMGEGNPNYGKIKSIEWKKKHSDILKKTYRTGVIWNELYVELKILWIKSNTKTGYMFSKWLAANTEHKFTGSQLKRLVLDFSEEN